MDRRTILAGAAAALGLLVAPGCALADDEAPDYRYRLTVEVDKPQGLRRGSSVIQVRQRVVRPGSAPAGRGVETRVQGEAVAVDLPGGRTLFALLRSRENVDWASYVFVRLAPVDRGAGLVEQLDDVLQVTGERTLPRWWPPLSRNVRPGAYPRESAYPMLVTFGDLADPTTVAEVDPEDLAASFGPGVTLKRITVQLTDDAVTTGIEERLGWLRQTHGTLLRRPIQTPIGDLPIEYQVGKISFQRSDGL